MLPKKRILEEEKRQEDSNGPSKAKIMKKVCKEEDEEEDMDDEMKEEADVAKSNHQESEKENLDEEQEDKKPLLIEVNETNMMTLQQFTDIVLASEGLTVDKKKQQKQQQQQLQQGKPVILESYSRQNQIHHLGVKLREEKNNNKNNNNNVSKTSDMVASLMQNNNDLIVEVKSQSDSNSEGNATTPVKSLSKPKPVVLSPRQPPGSHLLPHYAQRKTPLSNGVVVSVKPRVAKSPSISSQESTSKKVPSRVEEWLNKIPAPEAAATSRLKQEPHSTASTSAAEALNLSTKQQNPVIVSKTTQVYLRPIPTPPKLSSAPSTLTSRTARSLTNGSIAARSPKHPPPSSPISKPVTLIPKCSPNARSLDSNSSSSAAATPPTKMGGRLSPPRLEITRVAQQHHNGIPHQQLNHHQRLVGRATPFEDTVRLEAARARALRDVQLAHTKDMHGNL